MKKTVFLLLLLFATPVYADNSERIKELSGEFKELKSRQDEYTQVLQNIVMRQVQIQGIIAELENQDKPKEEKK